MKVDAFDYRLPPERIAQRPATRRDGSRLLVLDRDSGVVVDSNITELARWLDPDDLLVLNDTRVLAARMIGHKSSGGRVELLLLERVDAGPAPRQRWRCLLRTARAPRPGTTLDFGEGFTAEVLGREHETWLVRLESTGDSVASRIERRGRMPLPPYIRRTDRDDAQARAVEAEDRERYQTVFARHPGAVAAPTAGLHFTPELFDALDRRGIGRAFVTLHVGPGTFRPVRVDRVEDHVMHEEWFEIPESTAEAVAATRAAGNRVVAVGTTVARTLEHSAARHGQVRAERGSCDLFIYPGFEFRVIDALLTNFHLPRSTLLMLVSAFADRERVLAAYAGAIKRRYRFYSYGDAMLIRSPR